MFAFFTCTGSYDPSETSAELATAELATAELAPAEHPAGRTSTRSAAEAKRKASSASAAPYQGPLFDHFDDEEDDLTGKDFKSVLRILYCLGGGMEESAETYDQAMQRCRAAQRSRRLQDVQPFEFTRPTGLPMPEDIEPSSLEWWSGELRDGLKDSEDDAEDEQPLDDTANIAAATRELLNQNSKPTLEVTVLSAPAVVSPTVELIRDDSISNNDADKQS